MEKNKFKKPYEHDTKDQQGLPTGNGYENEYAYEVNKTGQKVLVCTGQTNLYEKIQEQLESTRIENVLGAVAAGDYSVLRPQGIYADISEQPKNLIEARQMILNLENTWNSLPMEVKEKFNNDVETFVATSGNVEWFEKLGMKQEPAKELAKTELLQEAKGESSNES